MQNISKTVGVQVAALICAWVAAQAAQALFLPLPWLLGPLLMAMLWQSVQIQQGYLVQWRQGGQWLIGTALGTYFSPQMLMILYDYAPLLLLGIVWALFLGLLLAILQYRLVGLDWATAWFASSMGGASEMVSLAERLNARSDQVAAAHSLRLVLLVFCVPLILQYLYQIDLQRITPPLPFSTQPVDLLMLLSLSLLGAYLAQRMQLLNAWVLGPLIMVAGLTLLQLPIANLPPWLSHLGQLLIGWSLGRKFPFTLFKAERPFFVFTLLLNLLGLGLSLLLAMLVAGLFGLDSKTLMLGFSLGGIAEMSLTAKALQLVVPVVITFQLTRLIGVLLTSLYFYRLTERYFRTRKSH